MTQMETETLKKKNKLWLLNKLNVNDENYK